MNTLNPMLAQMSQRFGDRANDANGPHLLGMLLMAVFIGLIVGAVVWAAMAYSRSKKVTASEGSATSSSSAIEILDQRLARGEIEPADYEARKKLLA